MKTQIRRAIITDVRASSDAAACKAIANRAYEKYIALMNKKPAPMSADYEKHLRDDIVFVLEDPPEIIGFAVVTVEAGNYWLDNLAVDTGYQKQGYGKQLIDYVEDYLTQHCDRYKLYTNVVMTKNIEWYVRLGFQELYRAVVDGYERIFFEKLLK